ncbi:MAG TPA: PspC domain-containing protein [Bacteroidetes bacterium]|nr:PspC domain-containing protein [Bacteroidota bacterium]
MGQDKRLRRSRRDSVIAGVCGGLGEYFNVDPVVFRVIWVVLLLTAGTGLLGYLICWIIIPREPEPIPGEENHE